MKLESTDKTVGDCDYDAIFVTKDTWVVGRLSCSAQTKASKSRFETRQEWMVESRMKQSLTFARTRHDKLITLHGDDDDVDRSKGEARNEL